MAVVMAIYLVWNGELIMLRATAQLVSVGADCLRIVSYGYLYAWGWWVSGLQRRG
jgi:hypothetical protein